MKILSKLIMICLIIFILMEKLLRYLLSILILCLLTYAYEDKETFTKRYSFYNDILHYSNHKMIVGADQNKGLACVANDFIAERQETLRVPKNLAICPYYLFPFKYEISSWLGEIPSVIESYGKEQKFGVFVLTYYVLYLTKAPKEEIDKLIKEKKMEQYYNIHEVDMNISNSFPKIMMTSATMEKEHFDLLNELGYNFNKGKQLESIFKFMSQKAFHSEFAEVLYPWMSNFNDFRWAYAIVMSRGMTVRVKEYNILEGIKEKEKYFTSWDKKNQELNNLIGKNVGAPCIVAYVDLCNHHQPTTVEMRDKRPIVLDTVKGYFINISRIYYHPGEEISYTYSYEPNNAVMLSHYGFTMRDNIFNIAKVMGKYDFEFTKQQFSLCLELGCIESKIKDPKSIPPVKIHILRIGKIDKSLLNLGRVKYLPNNVDVKQVLRSWINDKPISFANETSAWINYLNSILTNIGHSGEDLIRRNIRKAQKFRNKYRDLEDQWRDDEAQRIEWGRLKTTENIYLLDISYKIINFKHINYSTKNIIMNIENDLERLKDKYLS